MNSSHSAAVMPQGQARTPAESLAESCRSWLPGLTAQGDRLAVPLMGPSGTLSLAVELWQPSPWILGTADAGVLAAIERLGDAGAEILDAHELEFDDENERVSGVFARHFADVPARLVSVRDGCLALLWAAEQVAAAPARPTPVETRTERELQLSRIAEDVAQALFTAYHYHDGGFGVGGSWRHAPNWLKDELRARAERAVWSVDARREGDARRRARLWLQDWLREAFHLSWTTDVHHIGSVDERVRAAINRVHDAVKLADPAAQMFDLYERVLVQGPEAAFVKPIALGGAR